MRVGVEVTTVFPVSAAPRNATIGSPAALTASENGTVMPAFVPETPPGESEPPSSSKVEPVHTRSRISVLPLPSSVSHAT
jgi:hypothetical protein